MTNIRNLEKELWDAADLLRANSKVTSQEYCMPVLGLIFLRYAFSRFQFVEAELLKDRPMRNGRVMPVESADFKTKSAIFLPQEARYDWLLNQPDNIDIGQKLNHAMELIEEQAPQLAGILPKNYSVLQNELLRELLRTFNNSALNNIKDDVIGRIYEYFLNKFAPAVASDDGVFFTPKSLVRMIVNVIEPKRGTVLDPACGSGGMFVASADFTENCGVHANTAMTFYGQEKVEYNAKLCIMNMAVHGLNAKIRWGDTANSFYHDAHNLNGSCDFVMANPPFNVDKVKSETCFNAGRLPFGMPGVNVKKKEVSNGNYLWISYFYSYLNEKGRAGFVMAASATDSSNRDREIRHQLVDTGHVDVMLSVATNFFYTKSLPCTLWFFDKGKPEALQDKVLFIDSRNYFTVVDKTLNEWSEWQMKNLNAIVWLYRGETEKYQVLLHDYRRAIQKKGKALLNQCATFSAFVLDGSMQNKLIKKVKQLSANIESFGYRELLEHYTAQEEALRQICNEQLKQYDSLTTIAKKKILEVLKIGPSITAYKKSVEAFIDTVLGTDEISFASLRKMIEEYLWLTDKFGEDGTYRDIPGLCKISNRAEIREKNWSLTPGAYVGVVEQNRENEVDFAIRMKKIHAELQKLQTESNTYWETISKNFRELGL